MALNLVTPANNLFIRDTPPAQQVDDRSELLELEKGKIRSAIPTDFILSIGIIIIALSSVSDQPLALQIGAVSIEAILATIGVTDWSL